MNQTLIISSDADRVAREHETSTIVATTPLDAIRCLEGSRSSFTVILDGSFAQNDELATALQEIYPTIQIERGV